MISTTLVCRVEMFLGGDLIGTGAVVGAISILLSNYGLAVLTAL